MSDAFNQYTGVEAVNWSKLKHMQRSPLQFLHACNNPDNSDSAARRIGRAVHVAVLQPRLWDAQYAVFCGARRSGPDWTAFERENQGRTILRDDEVRQVFAMDAALRIHAASRRLLDSATHTERPIVWTDPRTGIVCKGLLDMSREPSGDAGWIGDLKTGPALNTFERWIIREGYHLQLGFYRRGWWELYREEAPCFIPGVEAKAPYDVGVFGLDSGLLAIADREIDALLIRLAECRASGVWPGAYPETCTIHAPAWMFPDINIPDEGFEVADDVDL